MARAGPAGLLRRLEAERSHALTVRLAQAAGAIAPLGWLAGRIWGVGEADPVTAMGITFPNRVGIAAGFDKDAIALRGLQRLGVGHVEIGTVTPHPQPGNDKPRVFRLPDDQSVINRMGFPSRGADFVARRLERSHGIVGVNLGKAAATSIDAATADYVDLATRFAPLADYLAVNVSSPNTPGLRDLQRGPALRELLAAVVSQSGNAPVVAKLSPDLDDAGLDDALGAILDCGVDGVIATNTTVRRTGLTSAHRTEAGGLSGAGLTDLSASLTAKVRHRAGTGLTLISVGGIMSGAEAAARIEVGADLVQVYTGLVYRGPALLRELVAATQ